MQIQFISVFICVHRRVSAVASRLLRVLCVSVVNPIPLIDASPNIPSALDRRACLYPAAHNQYHSESTLADKSRETSRLPASNPAENYPHPPPAAHLFPALPTPR